MNLATDRRAGAGSGATHALRTSPWQIVFMAAVALVVMALYALSPPLAFGLTLLLLCGIAAVGQVPNLMIAVFGLMPFQQSILGETSALNLCFADLITALLLIALPFWWLRRGRIAVGPVAVPLLLFLVVVTVSAGAIWHGMNTAMALVRFFRGTALPILLFGNADLRLITARRCFTAFLVGINVLSLCSLTAFATGGIDASMYTLSIHKNALGPTFGCGVAICVAWMLTDPPAGRLRAWLYLTLVGAVLGLVLTLSRGGWISTGAGIVFILVATRKYRLFLNGSLLVVPLIAALWFVLPQKAKDYATDVRSRAENVQLRLVAMDKTIQAFEESPVFGNGIDFAYMIDPHNVVVLTLGETGLLGLAVFVGLVAGGFQTFRVAGRYAQRDPVARQVVLMGAATLLISIVAGTMDVYWRRGVGFMGWACVGLAGVVIRIGRDRLLVGGPDTAEQAAANDAASDIGSSGNQSE